MKFRILYIVLSAVTVVSCKKNFLEKFPVDKPSSATFFSNETELTLAINSAYRSLYWLSNDDVPYQLFIDGATDITWIRGDFANMQAIQSGQHTSQTDVFNSIWANFYDNIARCNNILDNMHRAKDNVSEQFYNRIEAQARFLRAYSYAYLINLYGDVPLVTHLLTLNETQLARTPKAEIVDQLFADLDFSANNLPKEWTGNDKGRITQGAALGLKARIALYAGRYDVAALAAGDVINLGVYSIYPDYRDLFTHAGENSGESILSMPFLLAIQTTQMARYLGTRSAPGFSVIVPTQNIVDMYQCTDGKRIDQTAAYDPANPFDNRDPRLEQSILYPGQWFNTYLFLTHPDSTTTRRNVNGNISTVSNLEVTHAYATFTGYIWKKYLDETDLPANVTRSELDFMLMRYAEVLLTYAEAKIELNQIDQSVIDAINQVRQRPGVNMPAALLSMGQTELSDLVHYERTIELAGEGLRLFDIRRWQIAEGVLPGNVLGRRNKAHWYDAITPGFNAYGKPEYADENLIFQTISFNLFNPGRDYLWPVPAREMDLNKALTQNPGY